MNMLTTTNNNNALKTNNNIKFASLDELYVKFTSELMKNGKVKKVNFCKNYYTGLKNFSVNKSKTNNYTIYCDNTMIDLIKQNEKYNDYLNITLKRATDNATDEKYRNNIITIKNNDCNVLYSLISLVCANC